MASTTSNLLHTISLHSLHNAQPTSLKTHPSPRASPLFPSRRQLLFLSTTTTLTAMELPSKAQDIPLFGLRKKLKKAEEAAEELVKEGFQTAERGIEAAEKGIVAAEKGLETAEKEIENELSFGGGVVQAGVVVGAEVVGVLIATAVVNGILGPEGQTS